MQGAIEQPEPSSSPIDKLKTIYDNRPPVSEFFKTDKISIPASINVAIERAKKNISKFAFYHILMFALFNFLFILMHAGLVFPIFITAVCVYLCLEPVTIKGFTIRKRYAIGGCIVMHLLICAIFKTVASGYVSLFALNAFLTSVMVAHGAFLDVSEEEDEKV